MGVAQATFATWLRERIAPVLRESGYKGSGQHFHRRFDSNWGAINFQRSQWDTADEVSFAINLGTGSAVVMEALGVDPDTPPREVDCHWRQRLGAGMAGRDSWWHVRADEGPRSA